MRASCVLVVDPDPGAADVVSAAVPGADVHRVDSIYRRTPMEHQHPYVVATFTKPVDPDALRATVLAATITAASA
jgi:hypothetical protein